jgi:hypothetical protein
VGSRWIEENPLDCDDLARLAHRDEQGGLKLDETPLPSWTARMIAQVFKRCPDVADFADIALGQGALDLTTSVPDGEEG